MLMQLIAGGLFAQKPQSNYYAVYVEKLRYEYKKAAHDLLGWGCNKEVGEYLALSGSCVAAFFAGWKCCIFAEKLRHVRSLTINR
jgi:hypothetical protein